MADPDRPPGRDTCFVGHVSPPDRRGSISHHGKGLRAPDQPNGARGKPPVRATIPISAPLTLYVLFFIEVATRRLHITAATRNPDASFVSQQARNLCFELDQRETPVRFLIRDRDSKFSGAFDEVLRTEGIRTIRTPIRSPKANALAERCVKTLRHEVLDWTLILGRRHLDRVLASYACHYNAQRPHRGIKLRVPSSPSHIDPVAIVPEIRRRDLLGGLIHEYNAVAA
jgi:putative transposase